LLTYKLIAVMVAYGLLWGALSPFRVRVHERRLQLQLFGLIAALYAGLVVVTGGASFTAGMAASSPHNDQLLTELIRGYFATFATTFLVLGSLELALSAGFHDPSLPLLSRWWMRAFFEGPVWRLLSQRRSGTPFTPDESESCCRHLLAGVISIAAAFWALQVAAGLVDWGRLDPVALVIALKAINVWLDSRIRSKHTAAEIAHKSAVGCSISG